VKPEQSFGHLWGITYTNYLKGVKQVANFIPSQKNTDIAIPNATVMDIC